MKKIFCLFTLILFLTSCAPANKNKGNITPGNTPPSMQNPQTTPGTAPSTPGQTPSGNPPESGTVTPPATTPSAPPTTTNPGESSAAQPKSQVPATPPPAPSKPSKESAPVPTGTLPSIPSKVSFDYLAAVEDQILKLVNSEREKVGLSSLAMDDKLRQASRYKANEMLQYNYFEHYSPYTKNPWDTARGFGVTYTAFGENIWTMSSSDAANLRSHVTAEVIVNSWMNSPGHKANILNKNFRKMGIGVVIGSNGKCYASQMFSD